MNFKSDGQFRVLVLKMSFDAEKSCSWRMVTDESGCQRYEPIRMKASQPTKGTDAKYQY